MVSKPNTLPVQDFTNFAASGQNAVKRTLNTLPLEIDHQNFKLRFPPSQKLQVPFKGPLENM